ncbi:NifU family protein [Candidatus Alkanophaga liquidiphilum]|nr:Fe-S cluster biogenesis protein NfuA [Candidatus Alkanophaga liquidiphilum]
MFDRVKEIIETQIKPALAMEGGFIELVSVEDGVVKVRLGGACAGCPFSQMTLVNFVEATLKKHVPEVKRVEAVRDFRDVFGARRI